MTLKSYLAIVHFLNILGASKMELTCLHSAFLLTEGLLVSKC